MAYKRIGFLAFLFFAISINLPVTGTQADDNLIRITVDQLNQRFHQSTQPISFCQPSCRTFSFFNASEISTPILNKDLEVADAKLFKMEQAKKHDGLSKLTSLPKTKFIPGERVKPKRPVTPSGSLMIRIDPITGFSSKKRSFKSTVPATTDTQENPYKQAKSIARKPPVHRPSGSYLFQIEKTAGSGAEPALTIDPRILPNYQLADDPYWQYYGDCDQWNIVFAKEAQLAIQPVANTPPTGLTDLLTHLNHVATVRMARTRDWYGETIRPIMERFTNIYSNLAALRKSSRAPANTTNHTTALRPKQQSNLMTGLMPMATRLIFHEAFESQLSYAPGRWLNNRIDDFNKRYAQTWIGSFVSKFVRFVNEQHLIERNKRTQVEMKRVFATRINWLSIQLNRVAHAIDDTVEEQWEMVGERDEPVRY